HNHEDAEGKHERLERVEQDVEDCDEAPEPAVDAAHQHHHQGHRRGHEPFVVAAPEARRGAQDARGPAHACSSRKMAFSVTRAPENSVTMRPRRITRTRWQMATSSGTSSDATTAAVPRSLRLRRRR